jgi:hypothetical protein
VSQYEFVKLEDFDKVAGSCPAESGCRCYELSLLIERLVAERDAYREAGLRVWSGFGTREDHGAYEVDSEARAILTKGASDGQ